MVKSYTFYKIKYQKKYKTHFLAAIFDAILNFCIKISVLYLTLRPKTNFILNALEHSILKYSFLCMVYMTINLWTKMIEYYFIIILVMSF